MQNLIRCFQAETNPRVCKALATALRLKLDEIINGLPESTDRMMTAEEKAIYNNHATGDGIKKIAAIKMVRARTGLGLRDSKQLVEYVMGEKPDKPSYWN